MWAVSDALRLQQRIDAQFTRAATLADDTERRRAMSVAVVGAGATGVEIVGTLAYALPRMVNRLGYPTDMIALHLIDARPEILYDLRPPERARALARLERMGVRTHLGAPLKRVSPDVVELESGEIIPAETCVWCGGAHADPDAVSWGLAADNSGRLVVEPTLKARDHDDIYAVGDVSAFLDRSTGRILPMLAQFAIREAAHAAANVVREARGEGLREFRPHQHGEFVSVGPRWGVGWMFRFPVHGRFAILMKRLTYVMYWLEVGTVRLAWRRAVQMMAMHRY
jgi:NADH dehydrogenase